MKLSKTDIKALVGAPVKKARKKKKSPCVGAGEDFRKVLAGHAIKSQIYKNHKDPTQLFKTLIETKDGSVFVYGIDLVKPTGKDGEFVLVDRNGHMRYRFSPENVEKILTFPENMIKVILKAPGKAEMVGAPVASNPSWVMDEDKWASARKHALKDRGEDHPMYWGLVTHIYKKAGGRIRPGVDAQVGANAEQFVSQLAKGIEAEKEHTETIRWLIESLNELPKNIHSPNPIIEKLYFEAFSRIAQDHLKEIPDYYTRLAKMEAEAKKS